MTMSETTAQTETGPGSTEGEALLTEVPPEGDSMTMPLAIEAKEDERESESVSLLTAQLDEQTTRTAALEEQVTALERDLSSAIQRYRLALLDGAPEVPGDLVTGATVEELEESMARARSVVEQVRGQIEAETARGRVPAGSPARQTPDSSRLSAREKIALGLERL
jgi:hypothetical protein